MLLALLAGLSALLVACMIRVGALDHPVARSSHTRPTPKGGGVGIVAAFALGIALHGVDRGAWVLTGAAVFLAAASYLDDVRHWPFWLKLAAQIGAALAVLAAGFWPRSLALPGLPALPLGLAAPVLGLGWILFTTNATNFMDGLNGLAAGSAAVACLAFALAAGGAAAWPAWLVVAGVVGFLPFNYPAARIFMGDVGSQFLGFVLAGLALRHAGTPRLSAILPLGLSPLLLDAAFTLLRRARAGARLTEAHRGHLYQVAQRAGMPAWAVSAAYWAMAGWAGGCGVAWGAGGDAVWLGAALMPFGVWGVWVARFARRAGLGAWG